MYICQTNKFEMYPQMNTEIIKLCVFSQSQYNNAEQDDLWYHLTKAARQDNTLPMSTTVKEIMDTWTLQKHYPVVNIHRHANGSCTISQVRERSKQWVNRIIIDQHYPILLNYNL